MNVTPTKHFAFPPYKAAPSGGANDWWYVENAQGFNCLHFPDKPGAIFTDQQTALAIAADWNERKLTNDHSGSMK
jgi:hypothetical protein